MLTLHRPENVDDPEQALALVLALEEIQRTLPVVFPAHPRTRERFRESGVWQRLARCRRLLLTPPLGYLDFLRLVQEAAFVLTDSGGLQEETTALGVPCLTLRDGTERPATVLEGSNRIVGRDPAAIVAAARQALDGSQPAGRVPRLWDGRASERIVEALAAAGGRIRSLYRPLRARTAWERSAAPAH
jgi:UDP-N-acetylglucosamine 2-epimerase (non-hydrolysing)